MVTPSLACTGCGWLTEVPKKSVIFIGVQLGAECERRIGMGTFFYFGGLLG